VVAGVPYVPAGSWIPGTLLTEVTGVAVGTSATHTGVGLGVGDGMGVLAWVPEPVPVTVEVAQPARLSPMTIRQSNTRRDEVNKQGTMVREPPARPQLHDDNCG
jgi:hypothetical protein